MTVALLCLPSFPSCTWERTCRRSCASLWLKQRSCGDICVPKYNLGTRNFMTYNALSVVHPAATKIATGQKTLEIRSWKPPTLPLLNLLIVENHRRLDREGDIDPEGMAVALIDIIAVRDWTEEDARRDGHTFATGYNAWVISNVRPIHIPFRAQAERMIYKVEAPDEVLKTEQ